jgi:hypothetical protein
MVEDSYDRHILSDTTREYMKMKIRMKHTRVTPHFTVFGGHTTLIGNSDKRVVCDALTIRVEISGKFHHVTR